MAQILAKTGKRLAASARRDHLLDVAAEVLLESGFEALTMEAVKERAGVSRGLTYVHFANAEELAFALYEREVTELDRRIAEVKKVEGPFEERVRLAMKTYFDFAKERGGVLSILQVKLTGRWSNAKALEALDRRFKFWSDEIERELRLPAHVAGPLARAAVTAVESFAAAWRTKKLGRREAEEMARAFALGGVRAAVVAHGATKKS